MAWRLPSLKRARSEPRNSPFIVFSWSGVVLILFVIVVFFLSRYRSSNANLWVFGVALIVVGVLAMIQTNENMRSVALELLPTKAVPEGDEIVVAVRLANSSPQMRYAFSVAFQSARKRCRREPSVGARAEVESSLTLPPQKRGVVPIPPMLVWSFFPFGLCLAWKRLREERYAIVYPKPEGVPLSHHPMAGERQLAANGLAGIDDVTGLRRYQYGDSPNAIDWRLFARRGTLFVRSRDGGEGGEFELDWEQTRALEETELRLRQLSRWIHDCRRLGIPFRLQLPGFATMTHRNLEQCFEALARFDGEAHA
jgi:uncharacterized protein (DUF58 family)